LDDFDLAIVIFAGLIEAGFNRGIGPRHRLSCAA
jgi:hypothetical protein